ncbi:MAG: hypothetical protein ACOCQM_04370 [Natronomonas sp.]
MVSSETLRRGARAAVIIAGFIAGFLLMAGLYGFVFPERLVDRGFDSTSTAYLVSAVLLVTGAVGMYLQQYVTRRFLDEA